jgi:hypothetical protein
MSPAFVRRQFIGREIEDDRARTGGKRRKGLVDCGIAELVIGRIHQSAAGAADAICESAVVEDFDAGRVAAVAHGC